MPLAAGAAWCVAWSVAWSRCVVSPCVLCGAARWPGLLNFLFTSRLELSASLITFDLHGRRRGLRLVKSSTCTRRALLRGRADGACSGLKWILQRRLVDLDKRHSGKVLLGN